MMKVSSILTAMGLASALLLTGCSDSGAAHDTAEAVMGAMMSKSGESEEVRALLSQQPEWQSAIQCIADQLDGAGWTQDQHDEFMSATGNTGNLREINRNKYSEGELIEKFGAVLATSSCM